MKTSSFKRSDLTTFVFTLSALISFAANSVLARLALINNNIDAISFTIIRLLSGAVMLFLLLKTRSLTSQNHRNNTLQPRTIKGSWLSAFMLFIYAAGFSTAYVSLETGTGALILFSSVQISIIVRNLIMKEPLNKQEWLGMSFALIGFVLLVLPNLSIPSLKGFVLMTISGIAWALYTLRGRICHDPLSDTAGNFIKSLPFCIILIFFIFNNRDIYFQITSYGLILSVISGAITSGLGYALWYVALRNLTPIQAGISQLTVPIIAAFGGGIFLSEMVNTAFIFSSCMILGGILLITLKSKSP